MQIAFAMYCCIVPSPSGWNTHIKRLDMIIAIPAGLSLLFFLMFFLIYFVEDLSWSSFVLEI